MYSIILTAFDEAHLVGRAIDALLPQLTDTAELIVVCPDGQTTAVVQRYAAQYSQIHPIADQQKGKPAALNLGIAAAVHDLLVLTDGDVVVAENALQFLLAPFANEKVGAVTGRPLSTSSRQTMLGYWSHLLVHAAHLERSRRHQAQSFMVCSGYLFAIRKSLIDLIPEDVLAEDAVLSHRVAQQGFMIQYAPQALVYVKYPATYADWLKQKVRSAGGYAQPIIRRSPFKMRSARLEALHGLPVAFQFPQNLREIIWTKLLFVARLHLWLLVFWRVRVQKRPFAELWQPVKSTK